MKTKTYKRFIGDDLLDNLKSNFYLNKCAMYSNPVTITVEVEEPRIEITPSELRRIMKPSTYTGNIRREYVENVIEERFGKEWRDE